MMMMMMMMVILMVIMMMMMMMMMGVNNKALIVLHLFLFNNIIISIIFIYSHPLISLTGVTTIAYSPLEQGVLTGKCIRYIYIHGHHR